MREPAQKRRLAALGMMEALHHDQRPVEGVMGWIHHGAGHGQRRGCTHRIPARLLRLAPLPPALTMGCAGSGRHGVRTAAPPLAQRAHPQPLPLSHARPQPVARRAEGLAPGGRDGRQCPRECVAGVTQAEAKPGPRQPGPPTLRGPVAAIAQTAPAPLGWRLRDCDALARLIGLRQGSRTGLRGVAHMPEDATPGHGRQVPFGCQTTARLLIGQERDRQGQTTPGQDRHQTVVAEGTAQAIERQRRDLPQHRPQRHTQPPMRRHEGGAGHLRRHLVLTQDAVGQASAPRTTRGALEAPEGDATQAHTAILGGPRQAPATATGGLVFALKAKSQEQGEHACDQRLAVAQPLHGGGFVLKIDGAGPVFTSRAGCGSPGHPQVRWSMQLVTKDEGTAAPLQEAPGLRRGFTTKLGGMCLLAVWQSAWYAMRPAPSSSYGRFRSTNRKPGSS